MKAVSLSFYFYKCTESVLLISVVMMYILTKFLKSLLHPHPLCRQCDHHLDLARDDNDPHPLCRQPDHHLDLARDDNDDDHHQGHHCRF